jgi:S1-C subfamily serine protease
MRTLAAIFTVLLGTFLGTSIAVAENDPRTPYGPQTAQSKAQTKAEERAARRQATAKAKPKAEPKAEPKTQRSAKPAEPVKPEPAKPEIAKGVAKEAAKPTSATPQKPDPKADPKTAAAAAAAAATAANIEQSLRESYSAIPLAERIALQSDLIWTGDYNGVINGEFSGRLVEAVKSYQTKQKAKPTGLLNPQELAALRAAARPRQDEVGWRLTEDPATGARVGLPLKLATRREPATSGTRWSSQQGQLQIETFRIDTGATLEGVFERQKKDPPQRRVTFNVLRPDSFALSGTQGLKKFFVRGFAQNGEVRGITILYDQAEAHMDWLVAAMSSAFAPFATYAVASAADTPARKRVDYATGLVVSPSGHILTARQAIDTCQVIVVPRLGNAEIVAEQADGELALVRVYGARKLTPIGLLGTASPGGSATLVGIADPQAQAGGAAVTAAAARIGNGTGPLPLDSPPAPGFSGAAALDGKGELVGVAVLRRTLIAGAGGAPQATVVPAAAVRDFLEANHVAPTAGQAGVEHAKASVVRVICVRK